MTRSKRWAARTPRPPDQEWHGTVWRCPWCQYWERRNGDHGDHDCPFCVDHRGKHDDEYRYSKPVPMLPGFRVPPT